ncbi:hypothetical protein EUGRSUZ_E00272 [Eucalyptus grandis]|uniref:GPI-anchored wall transfer protein n=2 Tax=Eucalyptus grandis TaxID=71139 RepID=A0A059C082_EUCGR|nr:hypothetical protein EUGRSUZ_E00272 [Eucalyptus grandis]
MLMLASGSFFPAESDQSLVLESFLPSSSSPPAMDSRAVSFNPHKHLKEEFVSNLTGSSMLEIAALSTVVPVIVLLRHSLGSRSPSDLSHKDASSKNNHDSLVSPKSWRAYMATLTMDYLCIIVPMLLSFTVLSEWTYLSTILLTFSLFLSAAIKRFYSSLPSRVAPDSLRRDISLYRVCMMIVTCLCILAVDFRIFPRRYAKTETFGTGLMDLGVGSFVVANALVSRQARNISSVNLMTALRNTSPLIALGFGRLVSTAGVDYQVHVGEYGVHWNFFFTLAAVSLLTSLINISPKNCGILGFSILIGYQSCLMQGLNSYLISSERGSSIISQNKEGIFSIFGYWGMYLVGVQLGNYLFFGSETSATKKGTEWARRRVWIVALLFWLLTIILDRHVERVSRRMCNLAYVTLVLAQNFQVLAILMLSDYVGGSKSTVLEDAFNRNLLGSFLLANVLTGVVNLFFETLFASALTSLAILLLYAYVLSVITGTLEFYGIRLKFW